MTLRRRITRISSRSASYDAHERIELIAGERNGAPWMEAESIAIRQIKAKTHVYYVLIGSHEVEVVIGHYGDDEYLKTERDAYSPDNLLNLGEVAI